VKKFLNYFKRYSSAQPQPQPQQELADSANGNDNGVQHVMTDIGGKQYRIESDDNYLEHIRGTFEPHMVEASNRRRPRTPSSKRIYRHRGYKISP
jgi:hypothetical protein